MSFAVHRNAAFTALLTLPLAGCGNRDAPAAPSSDPSQPVLAPPAAPEDRNERLAYRLALALRDQDFRATVHGAVRSSRYREGKVYLQRLLGAEAGKLRRRLAELAGEAEATVAGDLDQAGPVEVYLPVPGHRRDWKGGPNVLVATAGADHEAPVAFDRRGKRIRLDPEAPPDTPVIAVGRAEIDFSRADAGAGPAGAPTEPSSEDSYGSTSGGGTATPGLIMTYAKVNSSFEGWLKGAPEFEVHILGQEGSTRTMTSYQCAGAGAGGPYYFDMDREWRGTVMLFSQTQLDAYKAQFPGQALRVLVLEDDDGPCIIKADSARFAKMMQLLVANYGTLTGGRDTLISIKTFRKAQTLMEILKSAWSWLKTGDDIVGLAIEDVVAREYAAGANWIIKGENTATQGAIRLEMR